MDLGNRVRQDYISYLFRKSRRRQTDEDSIRICVDAARACGLPKEVFQARVVQFINVNHDEPDFHDARTNPQALK